MSTLRSDLLDYLQCFMGKPYMWGGDDPIAGFDCSGAVNEGLKAFGIIGHNEDYSSQALYDKFMPYHEASLDQAGSLVFFGANGNSIIHIGMAIDDRLMIEAGGGNSQVTTVEEAIKKNAFIRIRPIRYRRDFFTIIKPRYEDVINARNS